MFHIEAFLISVSQEYEHWSGFQVQKVSLGGAIQKTRRIELVEEERSSAGCYYH